MASSSWWHALRWRLSLYVLLKDAVKQQTHANSSKNASAAAWETFFPQFSRISSRSSSSTFPSPETSPSRRLPGETVRPQFERRRFKSSATDEAIPVEIAEDLRNELVRAQIDGAIENPPVAVEIGRQRISLGIHGQSVVSGVDSKRPDSQPQVSVVVVLGTPFAVGTGVGVADEEGVERITCLHIDGVFEAEGRRHDGSRFNKIVRAGKMRSFATPEAGVSRRSG